MTMSKRQDGKTRKKDIVGREGSRSRRKKGLSTICRMENRLRHQLAARQPSAIAEKSSLPLLLSENERPIIDAKKATTRLICLFFSVIPDVCNRESSVFKNVFGIRSRSRAISWRHCPAPAGVAAPRSRNRFGGEDCLSEASSAAQASGTGAKAPPWGHARAPMVLGPFAETKGPRRAGTKPCMRKTNTLNPYRSPGSPIMSGTSVEDDKYDLNNALFRQRMSATTGWGPAEGTTEAWQTLQNATKFTICTKCKEFKLYSKLYENKVVKEM